MILSRKTNLGFSFLSKTGLITLSLWVGLFPFKGVPLVSFNFQFSTPLVFVASQDINSSVKEDPSYGDKVFQQVTFPFLIGMNLGYIMSFDKKHYLLGNWKFQYSDDPINFLFDETTSSKLRAPSFTTQNINNSFILKYILKSLLPFMDFSPSVSVVFDLTKDLYYGFNENLYNFYSFNLTTGFKIHRLGQYVPSMKRMSFNFSTSYAFNYYPNGDLEDSISSDQKTIYPRTEKNFHNISAKLDYRFSFYQWMQFMIAYEWSGDLFTKLPILNTNPNEGLFIDQNERIFRHIARLVFSFEFFERIGYRLWEWNLTYLFRYEDSNHVESLIFGNADKIGELKKYKPLGNNLQEDYKDYMIHVVSFYSVVNFSMNYRLTTGYTFLIKNFLEVYGKNGTNRPIFGALIDEKRTDLSHIISASFVFQNDLGNRKIYPSLGLKIDHSNDHTLKRNRHIYFIGLNITYEL